MFFRSNDAAAQTVLKATWARGVVECPRCRAGNAVNKVDAVADEFSMRCSRCGHRSFHRKHEMGIQQMPERRRRKR